MQNRLYFNLNQISSIDKRWIFKEIEREKPKIGYYSLPESNISEIIDFEQSVSSSIKIIIVLELVEAHWGVELFMSLLNL